MYGVLNTICADGVNVLNTKRAVGANVLNTNCADGVNVLNTNCADGADVFLNGKKEKGIEEPNASIPFSTMSQQY